MKNRFVRAYVLTALAGSALHFAYTLAPVMAVGLFAPVNESVWEHLKLLYWPFLAAGFILCRKSPDAPRAWSGFLLAELVMPLFLLGIYYTLRTGFAVHALWLDLALYCATLALGFRLAYALKKSGRLSYLAGVLVIAVGLYGAALVLFTMAPPSLPIFVP